MSDSGREAAITRARLAKAQALAGVLLFHGATGAEVAQLPPASRRTVEALASVPVSSDATWAMVGPIVATTRALVSTLPADPFSAFGAS